MGIFKKYINRHRWPPIETVPKYDSRNHRQYYKCKNYTKKHIQVNSEQVFLPQRKMSSTPPKVTLNRKQIDIRQTRGESQDQTMVKMLAIQMKTY